MGKFYKKYVNVIVVGLAFLFICKSCQSCHRANQLEWNKIQHEYCIDSLNNVISELSIDNDKLKDTISIYEKELIIIGETNNVLLEANKSNQNLNSILIKKLKDTNK